MLCVPYALFNKAGYLDREAMDRQIQLCVQAGVDGFVILGLATEVHKLNHEERETCVKWIAAAIDGRIPFAVTVTGDTIAVQEAAIAHAAQCGASWCVLQLPAGVEEAACVRFVEAVAADSPLPLALQLAPTLGARSLSRSSLVSCFERNSALVAVKAELPAVEVAELRRELPPHCRILAGRGGLEFTDLLAAQVDGFVLAPDLIDKALLAWNSWQAGDCIAAGDAYARLLAPAVFQMQSLDHLLCYGKRLFAARTGLTARDRRPCLAPTSFGLERVAAYSEQMGPFPGSSVR